MQIVQYIRRNDLRDAAEKPLNRQFCMAAAPANTAEMAPFQQIALVMPPLCHLGAIAADMREKSAENANTKNLTQRRKETKTQRKKENPLGY